jgi:hypothetical protein
MAHGKMEYSVLLPFTVFITLQLNILFRPYPLSYVVCVDIMTVTDPSNWLRPCCTEVLKGRRV